MTPDFSGLTSTGDTVDLPDGRTLRLRIDADDVNPFDDYDIYGTLAWSHNSRNYGYSRRPDGFDGNAEKITSDGGSSLWWQPPADGPTRGSDGWRAFRTLVSDLLEYGTQYVTLELLDTETDAYRSRIVRGVASVGGVEPFPSGDYLCELLTELWEELNAEEAE